MSNFISGHYYSTVVKTDHMCAVKFIDFCKRLGIGNGYPGTPWKISFSVGTPAYVKEEE